MTFPQQVVAQGEFDYSAALALSGRELSSLSRKERNLFNSVLEGRFDTGLVAGVIDSDLSGYQQLLGESQTPVQRPKGNKKFVYVMTSKQYEALEQQEI